MTPVISCMMIEALMYGFTPRATIEKFDRPPPEIRSSTPMRALPAKNCCELLPVDARDRHVGQEPEDDQDGEDVEDPAPDVGRPEGVQQRFEHGLRGLAVVGRVGLCVDVAGRCFRVVGCVARLERRLVRPSSASGVAACPWTRASAVGVGALGVGLDRSAAASARRVGIGLGGLRLGLRCLRPPWRASPRPRRPRPPGLGSAARVGPVVDLPVGGCPAGGRSRLSRGPGAAPSPTPIAGCVSTGTSRTDTVPPAASILATADFVKASATTNSGVDRSPAPRIFSGLLEGPDEPDGAQDVLVDGRRSGLAGLRLQAFRLAALEGAALGQRARWRRR